MKGYIYKLTTPNNKIYIGQTKNVHQRKGQYNSMPSDVKKITLVLKNINKHGFANCLFEVIEECDYEIINEREIFWIEFYRSNICKYRDGNGLNLTCGGEGVKNFTHSDETKNKMSLSHLGKKKSAQHVINMTNSKIGSKRTDESKKKMSIAQTGKKRTIEQREKSSLSRRGEKNFFFGKKHSNETKEKIRLIAKENRKKGFYDKSALKITRLILNTTTGIFYHGYKEAADSIQNRLEQSSLGQQLRNKQMGKISNRIKIKNDFCLV